MKKTRFEVDKQKSEVKLGANPPKIGGWVTMTTANLETARPDSLLFLWEYFKLLPLETFCPFILVEDELQRDPRLFLESRFLDFPPCWRSSALQYTQLYSLLNGSRSRYAVYWYLLPVIPEISWIRRKDYNLLTVGAATYAGDERFQTVHTYNSNVSTLYC
ncbi:unnamed protein product [Nezara viridula]|uniref:Uncharacterized protein n=1 Tax=Nezara viridula TaxID=85310 RepID=A0A9P0H4H0_NEZVI|nr:unnamed protein product [Nezara viridula]